MMPSAPSHPSTPARADRTGPKRITLCADDYALHPAVDDAVLHLARQGRLSATSCMATAPGWPAAAARLQAVRGLLDVGLHFNLTEGHGLAATDAGAPAASLPRTLLAAYGGRLRPAAMASAWQRQLDAFEDAWGAAPDFVDGHQHVHQLPGVRDALVQVLQARYGGAQPYVRVTVPPPGRSGFKETVLTVLGGWTLRRRLRRGQVPHNSGFGGVYGFDAPDAAAYGARMRQWLAQARDGGLLMCHPASGWVEGDAIAAQRPVEFEYLQSDAFGRALDELGVRLVRRAAPQPA